MSGKIRRLPRSDVLTVSSESWANEFEAKSAVAAAVAHKEIRSIIHPFKPMVPVRLHTLPVVKQMVTQPLDGLRLPPF
jgi:hypothetical protein